MSGLRVDCVAQSGARTGKTKVVLNSEQPRNGVQDARWGWVYWVRQKSAVSDEYWTAKPRGGLPPRRGPAKSAAPGNGIRTGVREAKQGRIRGCDTNHGVPRPVKKGSSHYSPQCVVVPFRAIP